MRKAILAAMLCLIASPAWSAGQQWSFERADPPVTLPDLIKQGGRLVNMFGFRPEETKAIFGIFFIQLDDQVFRCITENMVGQPCTVAKNN
jgi:hypothetical protein